MRLARLTAATTLLALTGVTLTGGADTALATSAVDLAGPAGSGAFGGQIVTLANGNFVVIDTDFDAPGIADVGAVYLFDGATRALISTLTGSAFGDSVGSDGIVELPNGNFVVVSDQWDNGPAANAGAVTWVSGTAGLNGTVSAANSLVGATANDHIGGGLDGVVVLSNGNYVVNSPQWDSGGIADRGAVTWAAATGGTVGAVSGANSIVGSQLNDRVGGAGITALTSGGYVVASPDWDTGVTSDVGAATWADGNVPASIVVGPLNSLVGVLANDRVAGGGVVALTNGNYVVESPQWQDVGASGAGAVTWGNGDIGTVGAVGIGNSLIGVTANDHVGDVTALPNGGYVVASPNWDNGGTVDAGAFTLGSPSGLTGQVSAANSIVGTHLNDSVGSGSVNVLANGNYVVASPDWNSFLGAATFGLAAGVTAGPVGAGNSLVGTQAGDSVGSDGAVALTNGNYVVVSTDWHNGAFAAAGAATWGNGSTGTVGTVTSSNSLVGGTANDRTGSGGVVPLANGNYVVASPLWTNGANPDAGATTWGSGASGVTGTITIGNSLFGTNTNDRVGGGGVTALPSGHYVVASPEWNSGALVDAGAVTFLPGGASTAGAVTTVNSLAGGSSNDDVGSGGVFVTATGNYVVVSPSSSSGAVANVGAVTWASGTTGLAGSPSSANSLVGAAADDRVGSDGLTLLPNGAYLIKSYVWDNGVIIDAGAVTFGGLNGVRGAITLTNSALGLAAGDFDDVADRMTTEGAIVISRVARNTVTLLIADVTPPIFAVPPPDITAVAPPGATGAAVTYATPAATDNVGTPTVACTPPSGSVFAVGVTTVTCTATNSENLTASATFNVTVTTGADYVPLAPVRLADTRPGHTTGDGLNAGTGALSTGSVLELPVAGRGGVSADAAAATLNVTVTEAAAPGFVTVYPCGSPRPTASNLNFGTGTTIPNAVVAKIGDAGKVCLYASQPLHLVVDVNGEFPPTTSYVSANPARLLDTRSGQVTVDGFQQGIGAAKAGSVTAVQVAGRAGVAQDATAAVLNVTVTESAAPGYATVFPCGAQPPTASNLNYTQGTTIPNLVISKLSIAGTVCIYTQSETHLVVDVAGFFPVTTTYKAIDPARLLDTRAGQTTIDGQGLGAGAQPVGTVTRVHVSGRGGVPANATTAVLNVTVTEPTAPGYLTVFPCGIEPPLASNLNFVVGQTIPNAVIAKIGTNGDVCIFNSQPAQLVADVSGYFP